VNRVYLLREWADTVERVRDGAQVVLIRKGGISEGTGGFQAESRSFVLLPTLYHQHQARPPALQAKLGLEVRCELVGAAELPSDTDLSPLAGFHGYDAEQLRARVAYRPQRPLTVMVVRAWRWSPSVELETAGLPGACRSWVMWEWSGALPEGRQVVDERTLERAWDVVRRLAASRREVAHVAG
jgi:hypothetical protein